MIAPQLLVIAGPNGAGKSVAERSLEHKLQVREELCRRLRDTGITTRLIGMATRAVVREHKRLNNPIATWRDGMVMIVQPEDIEVDLDDAR